METNSANPVIWAVSDGRAGNVAMAMGLAGRVAGLVNGTVIRRDMEVSGPQAWLAARLPWLPSRLKTESYPQPDLVIGAGRRVAPAVAQMRKTGAKAVQILDPQMALHRFDLIVAPEHDGLTAPNTLATLGSVHRVSRELLEAERLVWAAQYRSRSRPLIAVMIGGSTKRAAMTEAMASDLAQALRGLVAQGVGLAVTASRRTPKTCARLIREVVPEAGFWDGTGENPYFGMLACADAVMVTDDSVNMASEAAATGKPLAIYPMLREGGKIARFHEQLIAGGYAQWFDGKAPVAQAGPLDETGRAAEKVAALF